MSEKKAGSGDQTPAAAPAENKAAQYTVWDKNQRGKQGRIHDIIIKMYPDGREPDVQSYELFSDERAGVQMPMEHAMKFLTDPTFIVKGPKGNRIMPVAKIDLSKPVQVLAEDEIVVKYEELSREALLRRVKVLPGSEDIKETAKVEDLAAFMVDWRRKQAGRTLGEQALAEKMAGAGFDSMNQNQLETMFPKTGTGG